MSESEPGEDWSSPVSEVNGKTCQWNTRREPVNKQSSESAFLGWEREKVQGVWGTKLPSLLPRPKSTNVGIHACSRSHLCVRLSWQERDKLAIVRTFHPKQRRRIVFIGLGDWCCWIWETCLKRLGKDWSLCFCLFEKDYFDSVDFLQTYIITVFCFLWDELCLCYCHNDTFGIFLEESMSFTKFAHLPFQTYAILLFS